MESLNALDHAKHLDHSLVTKLYTQLGGEITRQNGSHETWTFNVGGKKLHTTFFKHSKDRYKKWTISLVKSIVDQVLQPFLVKNLEE